MRSLVPTAVACLLLAQSICTKAEAANIVNLTQGQWEVTGSDSVNWNGSDLVFETQSPNGADFNITGYFDWYSREVYRGRELFTGTYTSNGLLNLRGFQLINPIGIGLANYQAEVLSPSQIDNGTWRLGGIRGIWTAINSNTVPESNPNTAAVPEPSSMLGLGIVALGGAMLKRRTKRKAPQQLD
ncbi:PEP-CTERM sorting domain-containing protein [Leptolyngbyaceae cyanobacterium UHCC 1019]